MRTTGAAGGPDEHISKEPRCVTASTGRGDPDFMKNMHHEGPDSGQVPEFLALGSPNPKVTTLERFLSGLCDTEDAAVVTASSLLVRWGEDVVFRLLPPESHLFSSSPLPCVFHHFTQRAQLAPDCCQPGPPRAAPSQLSAELCARPGTAGHCPSSSS